MTSYKTWFLATRPWSFTMSAISVGVGAALAAVSGPFSWPLFFLTLLAMILLHGATNLSNDYFDVRHGVDTPQAATTQYRPHPLVCKEITPRQVLWVSIAMYALALGLGLYLTWLSGVELLVIGMLGMAVSLGYTAPPVRIKYQGLGELAVFLMWGPFAVEGAYFVQRGSFSLDALWVSLPFGVLVALVLLANNIRDVEHDRKARILTLPILLGRWGGLRLYLFLAGLAYGAVVFMALAGPLSPWSLLVLLSLPLAARLAGSIVKRIPNDFDARTAQLDTVFGLLLLASLVLGHLWA